MRIAIFGIEGQLGSALAEALSAHDVVPVTEASADLREADAVRGAVHGARPEWVINAAAMTHVDRCETEPIPAFQINAIGARNVARAAQSAGTNPRPTREKPAITNGTKFPKQAGSCPLSQPTWTATETSTS